MQHSSMFAFRPGIGILKIWSVSAHGVLVPSLLLDSLHLQILQEEQELLLQQLDWQELTLEAHHPHPILCHIGRAIQPFANDRKKNDSSWMPYYIRGGTVPDQNQLAKVKAFLHSLVLPIKYAADTSTEGLPNTEALRPMCCHCTGNVRLDKGAFAAWWSRSRVKTRVDCQIVQRFNAVQWQSSCN